MPKSVRCIAQTWEIVLLRLFWSVTKSCSMMLKRASNRSIRAVLVGFLADIIYSPFIRIKCEQFGQIAMYSGKEFAGKV